MTRTYRLCSRAALQHRANSLSSAQNGCHYARTAATMQHGEHHKRLFVWCVGDDVVAPAWNRKGFVVRSGLLCPWCGNGTSLRTASRMSSRTRRAARGLSSRINSQMSVMSCAALLASFLLGGPAAFAQETKLTGLKGERLSDADLVRGAIVVVVWASLSPRS